MAQIAMRFDPIESVDPPGLLAPWIGPVIDVGSPDPFEDGVERVVVDQECVVARRERLVDAHLPERR